MRTTHHLDVPDAAAVTDDAALRGPCHGEPAVTARLEDWHRQVCSRPERLAALVAEHGSPLNLHHAAPFDRNVTALRAVAAERDVALEVFFARKADKAAVYVEHARLAGIGVDTASETELDEVLAAGMLPERVVCTAAIKSERLIRTCVDAGVTIVADGDDELERVARYARASEQTTRIALRISGFEVAGRTLVSRFGVDLAQVVDVGAELAAARNDGRVRLVGLHLHLDGYAAAHRIAAVDQSLPLIDALRAQGHPITSLDIGGGLPMSYVDDAGEWQAFRTELERALRGEREPITYGNHGLGLHAVGDQVIGALATYPYHQAPTAVPWLAEVLDAALPNADTTVAGGLRERGLMLRIEPGRSVLDGCGLTVARVEHRKQHPDGSWSIGLAMNRTQCSTAKADHAVDPLLLPVDTPGEQRTPPIAGFLTGATCTESELLTWRRLRFPAGVARGDLVVFPNTAGYLMHFVESRSHRFPLARNLVLQDDLRTVAIDPVDA